MKTFILTAPVHRSILFAALSVVLVSVGGCASMNSGTVQQIGKDSYTIRSMGESTTKAKQSALAAAGKHCTSQKRNVQLLHERVGTEDDGTRYHDVTFLCLPQNDPDFQRLKGMQFNEAQ